MHKQTKAAAISFLFFAAGAAAQTTVTGTGTANTIPLFTGSSTLGNSNITQSGGNVGIGTTSPGAPLDVNGYLHVSGNTSPTTAEQGAYLGWNALSGGVGETDFINNQGGGPGGFAFMNTSSSGSSKTTLMFINGSGNVGIGTTTPIGGLDVKLGTNQHVNFVANVNGGFNGTPGIVSINDTNTGFTPMGFWASQYLFGGGNVGIGTTSPGARLEVDGSFKLTQGSGASMTFQDGTVQSTAWNGTLPGGDYAESIDIQGDRTTYEPGDVIVIDPAAPGKFVKSGEAYSNLVAGVFSTKPGLVGRRATAVRLDKEAEVPMAMMGIVPTKVSTENGAIEPGNLLVTASTPGYAMKGTDRDRLVGAVIGKALAPLKSGTGVIEVLISLQ